MKIFGGVLPFIGFREVEPDQELRDFFQLPDEQKTISTFQVEWLNHGVVLMLETAPGPSDE